MRGPVPFRRRRDYVAAGPLPSLSGWLPSIGAGAAAGFLLYWADVTFHDAVFHPLHSLRDLAYGLGEVMIEIFRMLPFVLVATVFAVLVRWLFRLREDRGRSHDGASTKTQDSRA